MTILAALMKSDGIILCGDRLETRASSYASAGSEVATRFVQKLAPTGTPGVMWGFAGTVDRIGTPFGNWIRDQHFTDWDELQIAARKYFIRLTIDERKSFADCTGRPQSDSSLDTLILLAGHIDGKPRIVRFDHHGGPRTLEEPDEPIFVGTAESAFLIAWRMLKSHGLNIDLETADGMCTFLERSTLSCLGTSPPIDVWLLTAHEPPKHVSPLAT